MMAVRTQTDYGLWAAGETNASGTKAAEGKKQDGAAGAFAASLAQKIATLDDELRRLEKVREDVEDVDTLRRDAEDHGDIRAQDGEAAETLSHMLGDGSVLVTTTKDGKVVSQFRKKPHLVAVADPAAPKDALPSERVKMVKKWSIMDMI